MRCERIVLAAYDAAETIVGTVQVVFAQPENQPHRADVAKMLVHRRGRRRGVGCSVAGGCGTSCAQVGQDAARSRHGLRRMPSGCTSGRVGSCAGASRTTRSCPTARPAQPRSTTSHCAAREARRRPSTPRGPGPRVRVVRGRENTAEQKIWPYASSSTGRIVRADARCRIGNDYPICGQGLPILMPGRNGAEPEPEDPRQDAKHAKKNLNTQKF